MAADAAAAPGGARPQRVISFAVLRCFAVFDRSCCWIDCNVYVVARDTVRHLIGGNLYTILGDQHDVPVRRELKASERPSGVSSRLIACFLRLAIYIARRDLLPLCKYETICDPSQLVWWRKRLLEYQVCCGTISLHLKCVYPEEKEVGAAKFLTTLLSLPKRHVPCTSDRWVCDDGLPEVEKRAL